MDNFDQLVRANARLVAEIDDWSIEHRPKQAEKMLNNIKDAGQFIFFSSQRDWLESFAEYWAGYLIEITGKHYSASILPFRPISILENVSVFLYITIAAICKPERPVDKMIGWLLDCREFDFRAISYRDKTGYQVCNYAQDRKVDFDQIRNAWTTGEFVPSLLESNTALKQSRICESFQKLSTKLELELSATILPPLALITSDQSTDRALRLMQESRKKLILQLSSNQTAVMTLQIELESPGLDVLCRYSRQDFRQALVAQFAAFLNQCPLLKSIYHVDDPYLFYIVREHEHFPNQPAVTLVESYASAFYSLFTGIPRESLSPKEIGKFLQQNHSTREDVFLSLASSQAILIATPQRRDHLTLSHLIENASTDLIRAREAYNDYNYLLWLEILLPLRAMVFSKNLSKQVIRKHYKQTQGVLIARHATYQQWINDWKKILGIDSRYHCLV